MELAVKSADSKKARDIKALYIHDVSTIADYFVLCTANSPTQIKAVSDEIERVLDLAGEPPRRTEGKRDGGWVLVDFGVVVVHVFLKEMREFYSLERLWGDAPEADISSLINE